MAILADLQQQVSDLTETVHAQQRALGRLQELYPSPPAPSADRQRPGREGVQAVKGSAGQD